MLLLWMGAICLIVGGAAIGRRLPLPDAVIWCALGFAAGFAPGLGDFRVDPRLTLYVLLPPLVYSSSVQLPWPDFRDNLRPIGVLAVWLVLANTAVVMVVAHFVAGFPWVAAAALGAIVSPTDPVAASAVVARVGLPERVIAILEGEGLVNDAVALTALRLAVAAAATGEFSIGGGVARFLAIIIGEPLFGVAVAVAIMRLRTYIEDPRLEITVSLLTPFAAYLLPEHLGGSGILATVAAGMYVGERKSTLIPAGTRLHSTSVWDLAVFLLNGLLFLMAGMELQRVLRPEHLERPYLVWGLAVAGVVVAVRALWCGLMWAIFRGRSMLRDRKGRPMPARQMGVIAWSGMRGPISLAAALSIPGMAEATMPHFEALVFITAIVIVVTLVAQGVSLPRVTAATGVARDGAKDRRRENAEIWLWEAESAKAAMDRLGELEREGRVASETAASLRRYYQGRTEGAEKAGDVLRLLIDAERARVYELRRQGRIRDRALERLERALDVRERAVA